MRKLLVFTFALFVCRIAVAAPAIDVLSDADESLYTQIFMLQDAEKIASAQNLERQLSDPILKNEVLYQRYFSKTYHTKSAEVKNWMDKYNDMPGATRMEKLSKLKKVSVKHARVPSMLTGGLSIETAQSETWTAKEYSGSIGKKITKFKKAIRGGSTKTARQILEDKSFKKKLTESDY